MTVNNEKVSYELIELNLRKRNADWYGWTFVTSISKSIQTKSKVAIYSDEYYKALAFTNNHLVESYVHKRYSFLDYVDNTDNSHDFYHRGNGTDDPDFIDRERGVYYEVKALWYKDYKNCRANKHIDHYHKLTDVLIIYIRDLHQIRFIDFEDRVKWDEYFIDDKIEIEQFKLEDMKCIREKREFKSKTYTNSIIL